MDQDRIWIVAPIVQGGWMMHLSCYKMDSQVRGWWRKWWISEYLTKSLFLQNLSFQNLLWSYFQCHRLHPPRPRQTCEQNICENNTFPGKAFPLKAFDWELGKLQEVAAESIWVLGEAEKMNSAFEMCELQKVELTPPWKIPSSVEPFPTNLSRRSTIASLSRALEELQSILWKATLHKRSVGGLKSKQGSGEEMRAVCSVKCEVWSVKSTQSLREVFAKVFTNPTPLQY